MSQHQHWIAQARQHLKEHLPKTFARLRSEGTLNQHLTEASAATGRELENLMGQGFSYQEAWEQVREAHLFPPEEPGASQEAPASAGYLAMTQFNQDLASLKMPGEQAA